MGESPVFVSLDLETPLGLATFLANSAHMRKIFIPATFNVSKIIKSIKTQDSKIVVCDKDLFEMAPPEKYELEMKQACESVKKVIIASGESSGSSSKIFAGVETVNIDPYTL
mmetsp:Transcript_40078/g.38597  ORF Transcript_40078/g.38597 Transcript_40078/m.38597 type:complete len:112 (+) Transcript_40078:589-924(+)